MSHICTVSTKSQGLRWFTYLFGSSIVINITCINPLGTFLEEVKEQHHWKMEKMSVNPEETVCGGKTVTETDIYLCFGKSIEELYAHNSQQQKCFQPQFVEE